MSVVFTLWVMLPEREEFVGCCRWEFFLRGYVVSSGRVMEPYGLVRKANTN